MAFSLALWNHAVGRPYQYGIQAGHIVKYNNSNGQMWTLRPNGWQATDKLPGYEFWH